jgi:hypothetical protein
VATYLLKQGGARGSDDKGGFLDCMVEGYI